MNENVFLYKVYIVYFVMFFFMLWLFKKERINRQQSCVFWAVYLIIGLCFRDIDQGLNDTRVVYKSLFQMVEDYTFVEMIGTYFTKYTSILFVWIIKFISIISFQEFRVFLIICAILFVITFEYFIYKMCEDIYIANTFFVIFIFPYGFYLLRQCMAMSFIVLSVYKFIMYERDKRKCRIFGAVFCSAIAVMIHPLSGIFYVITLLFQIAKRLKIMDLVNRIIIVLTLVILIVPEIFIFVFNFLPEGTKYSVFIMQNHYASGELWLAAFCIYSIISIYLFIRYNKDKNNNNFIFVGFSLCTMLFISTTTILQDLVRLAYFFTPLEMVILSKKETFKGIINGKIAGLLIYTIILIYGFFVILPQSNIIRW